MRVIAGTLGGRQFKAPTGHRTHPMSDKMRGALFNMLGDVGGWTVLDPFAGSGALGFEAISRGAAHVLFIEKDRAAQQIIDENLRQLGLRESSKLVRAAAGAWLATDLTRGDYDLILLDPPYDALPYELLPELADRAATGGIVVLSWPGKQSPPELRGCNYLRGKSYGDGSLHLYTRL